MISIVGFAANTVKIHITRKRQAPISDETDAETALPSPCRTPEPSYMKAMVKYGTNIMSMRVTAVSYAILSSPSAAGLIP